MTHKLRVLLCWIVLLQLAHGQQSAADQLLAAGQWQQAEQAYATITAADGANGAAWAGQGEALFHLSKFDDSAAAFQKAIAVGYQPVLSRAKLARAYAAKGDRTQLLAYLRSLAGTAPAGKVRLVVLSMARDFSAFADDAEYKAALNQLLPCKTPEYRSFDFWIGDWAVESPQGKPLGKSSVTVEQDGCLLVEHWHSGLGYETGTSFNFYDVHDKKWHQLYIDNQGDAESYPPLSGTLQEGKMVLLGAKGAASLARWTWYEVSAGRVRQMSESSRDGGKTWQTVWDSIYIKK